MTCLGWKSLRTEGAGRREDYQESLRIAKVARATVDADRASANAALKNIASHGSRS